MRKKINFEKNFVSPMSAQELLCPSPKKNLAAPLIPVTDK